MPPDDLTYTSYLKLDRLLELQEPRSQRAEHDELLFIVIHQVYELWFKLLLHELDKIRRDFTANDLFGAIATFKRADGDEDRGGSAGHPGNDDSDVVRGIP